MRKTAIFLILILFLTACSQQPILQKTSVTKQLMGTEVTITTYTEDKTTATKSIAAAFKEIERKEGLMSNYINTSEVYILNQNKFLEDASDDLLYVLIKSNQYSVLSNGSFDITVQPILDLYTKSFKETNKPPELWQIGKTQQKYVDYKKARIESRAVSLKEGMSITLGGIAKGYAIDAAIKVLENNGINHALVNAGGDMRAIGNKGTEDWSIALKNPRNEEEYITMIDLNNRSIATSGDYERYFDENKTFHHIIDPRSGLSATELISVTIVTEKAIDADALATSVFVLGPKQGMDLIENLDNVEGLLITNNRSIIKSSGFSP